MVVLTIPDQPEIHIDTSLIPQFRAVELAKASLRLVEQVFSREGEEERYQEWLRKRKEEKRDNS